MVPDDLADPGVAHQPHLLARAVFGSPWDTRRLLCALPYFVLKLSWLSGGTVGVSDLTMLHDAGMIALNTITAGMDLVAILIALAFTHRWGLRVPAWLLLPPMWVASGLLARFAFAVPITTIAAALTSSSLPRVPADRR